jgi:serine/threonine-protein kinase
VEAVSEVSTEFEPAENPSPDSELPAEKPARRWTKFAGIAVIALVVLLTLVTGVGAWASQRATTSVPQVIGIPVPAATGQIAAADLTIGTMPTIATLDYGSGIVVDQLPAVNTQVPVGSSVDLLVAVAPTQTVTPDVSLETTSVARVTLGRSLLTAVVYEQLSDSVDFGRVVGQLPRAGQPIMTGQPVVLFVSAGRGSGGAIVPDVLGKPLRDASTEIAGVYLLTQVYSVYPGMSMDDKVVDQLPAPGTHVPVGSPIEIITANSSK